MEKVASDKQMGSKRKDAHLCHVTQKNWPDTQHLFQLVLHTLTVTVTDAAEQKEQVLLVILIVMLLLLLITRLLLIVLLLYNY